ncbi:MAG: tetratricopeptide repeat protein, partial [Gemmatimonadaceae bacterium]|nr:tetratricopeptide repeat protein [Gemmatimonadaceae bacterium]
MMACRRTFVALVALVASGCRAERRLSTEAAFRVADSLRMEGRSAQADSAYQSLRTALAATSDTASLWKAQLWWAYELTHLAKRDSAREALRGAQALTLHSPSREGWTQYVLSVYYDRQGMFDSSIAAAERMRALSRVAHDSALEVQSYNASGRAYSLTGRYREALADHEHEVSLARAVGGDTSRLIATAWNEIGIDYKHFGRFTDASHAYGRALALERRRRNPEGIARVQSNLANLYVATGDFAPAETLMLASLREAERIGLVRGEVYLHNDLADLYRRNGNPGAARHHLERALALNRNGFLAYGRVQSLDDLGALELALGNSDRADSALTAARMLADASHFGRERVSARSLLSSVAVAERRPAIALRWASEAVHLADSMGDPDAQAQALEARAAALEAAGR